MYLTVLVGANHGAKAEMDSSSDLTSPGLDRSPAPGQAVEGWVGTVVGPVIATAHRPLAWASWLLAALSMGYIAVTIRSPGGIVAAIVLPLLVLRLPVTAMTLIVIVAEEINPNGHYGLITTLGNQAYLAHGKVPIVLPLALTAASAAAARWWPARFSRAGILDAAALLSVAGLILLTIVVGLAHGQSVFSAVNQNSRPFILLGLGIIIGLSLRKLPAERTPLKVGAAITLAALLLAAAIAIPLGGSADVNVSRYFIYYDSALPTIAGAVFLALLVEPGRRWDRWKLVLLVVTPVLVLISFRRSVWLAAAVVFVVVVALAWARWRTVAWRFGFASVIVLLAILPAPGFAADLGLRSGATLPVAAQTPSAKPSSHELPGNPNPAGGGGGGGVTQPDSSHATGASVTDTKAEKAAQQAVSTAGHVEDLRRSWTYIRAHFWTGAGPEAPQLPGLAAASASRVYVHNELLQDWLRYGPLAPLLMTILLAATALLALRTLRDSDGDAVERSAAIFCLLTPICVMTAPFLSDTSRWPVLFGVAVGILILRGGHAAGRHSVERGSRRQPVAG
jgi:O-Antigen ligase